MGSNLSNLNEMAKTSADYYNNLSKQYNKEVKVTKSIKTLNTIAANFLRNTNKIQENSCEDMVILTEKILERNFQHLELENIINEKDTDNNKMIYFLDKHDFQEVMGRIRENRNKGEFKKEACKKIAKYYIDIKIIFDAIKEVIDFTRDEEDIYKTRVHSDYNKYETLQVENISSNMINKLNIEKEKILHLNESKDYYIANKFKHEVYKQTNIKLDNISTKLIVLKSDLQFKDPFNSDKDMYKITLQYKIPTKLSKIKKEYKSFCQSRIESLFRVIDSPGNYTNDTICNTFNPKMNETNLIDRQKSFIKLGIHSDKLKKLKINEEKNRNTCNYLNNVKNKTCLSESIARLEEKYIDIISNTKKNYTQNINAIYSYIDKLFIEEDNKWTIRNNLTISDIKDIKKSVVTDITKCYSDCEKDYKLGLDLYKAYVETSKLKIYCDEKIQYSYDETKYKQEMDQINNIFLTFQGDSTYNTEALNNAKTDIDRIIRGRHLTSSSTGSNNFKINEKINKEIDIFITDYIKKWKKKVESIQHNRDIINNKIIKLDVNIQKEAEKDLREKYQARYAKNRPHTITTTTNDATFLSNLNDEEDEESNLQPLEEFTGGSSNDNEIERNKLKQLLSTYNNKIKSLHTNYFKAMKEIFQETMVQTLADKYNVSTSVVLSSFNKILKELNKIKELESADLKLQWWSEKVSEYITPEDLNIIQDYYIQLNVYQQVKALFKDGTKEQLESIQNSNDLYEKQKNKFDKLVNRISDSFSSNDSPRYEGQPLTKDLIKKIFYSMFNINVIENKKYVLDIV